MNCSPSVRRSDAGRATRRWSRWSSPSRSSAAARWSSILRRTAGPGTSRRRSSSTISATRSPSSPRRMVASRSSCGHRAKRWCTHIGSRRCYCSQKARGPSEVEPLPRFAFRMGPRGTMSNGSGPPLGGHSSCLAPYVLEMGAAALSRAPRCEGAVWMNSLYDVGGMDGFGPAERGARDPVFHEPWEAHMRAVDALMLKKLHAYCVDETRHRIERINPVYYLGSSYYQIWLLRMESLLTEKGYVTEAEGQAEMREVTPETPTSHLESYHHIIPLIR